VLPKSFDDNEAFVVLADARQGFHLLLVSQDMLAQPMPFDPLWVFECGDQRSLNAASHWLAVRRGQWQECGKLAETQGREALGEHLAELMAAEPVGEVQGTIVRFDPDPRSLTLGESVFTHGGPRNEILYSHRFSTTGRRKRFLNWFQLNVSNGGPECLINLGVKEGTAALASKLEEIAAGLPVSFETSRAA
jgi:hypothetical protein